MKTFEEITVQDIAQLATVNRATFYADFEDKYVLLEQSVDEELHPGFLHEKLPPGSKYSPGNLQVLIQTVCEFLEHLRTHCAPSTRNQFDSLVESQVKQQVYAPIPLEWLIQNSSSSSIPCRNGIASDGSELGNPRRRLALESGSKQRVAGRVCVDADRL